MTQSVWNKFRIKPYALAAIPLLLVAGAVTLAVHADDVFAQPVDGVQTLVFMRHAEKPADGLGQLTGRVDVAIGQHMHVAAAGLVEVLAAGCGGIGDRGRHRHADAEHLVAGGHPRRRPVTDDHTGSAGAHQVQRGAMVEHTAGDHGDVQLGDEGLEVQRELNRA